MRDAWMNDKKQFVNILGKTTFSQIEQPKRLWEEAKERKEEDKENKTCLMLQL